MHIQCKTGLSSIGQFGLTVSPCQTFYQYVHACLLIHFSPVQLFFDTMDYTPPGFCVHGILQAIILEWVALSSSRGSSQPRGRTRVSCGSCIAGRFFTAESLGKLQEISSLSHFIVFLYFFALFI